MKRVLVTGARGFIGQHLVGELQRRGLETRILLRPGKERGPEAFAWDLDGEGGFPQQALQGVDTVFHLAGRAHAVSEQPGSGEELYRRTNLLATERLLAESVAAGVERFCLFSSVKAMGEGGAEPLDETAPCHPETPYGRSKREAEERVLAEARLPHTVVLRLCMVYGPGAKGNLTRMAAAIARGRFLPLPPVPNRRSMVHVEDVVQAALLSVARPEAGGKIFIVTDGEYYSTAEITSWMYESLGKTLPPIHLPLSVLRALARVGDGIGALRGRRFLFDSSALEKLLGSAAYSNRALKEQLGFTPKWGLKETIPGLIAEVQSS
ncbi:MAG: NAD-dependent epimerase/dehydratase family protein [Magnetococcales bacterium]|nr:NAD-dependent epimerase/dehydratase family protein [Magnetococcales bacterium]